MNPESYCIEIIHANGRRAESQLFIGTESPKLTHRVHLILHVLGKKLQAHDTDYFAAMGQLRLELEKLGLLMDCWGASRNVSVSATCEELTLGRIGCRLTLGRPVLSSDYVSIFDTGEGVEPTTVEEQKAFHKSWLESLGWQFDLKGKMTGKTLKYNPYRPPVWIQARWRMADAIAGFRRKSVTPAVG